MKSGLFTASAVLVLIFSFSMATFAQMPKFPKDTEVEKNITSDWGNGKIQNITKKTDWTTKVSVESGAKIVTATCTYLVKFKNGEFSLATPASVYYVLAEKTWHYKGHGVSEIIFEPGKGQESPSRDDVKMMVAKLVENGQLLNDLNKPVDLKDDPYNMKKSVKVTKVLVTEPVVGSNGESYWYDYYCDVEITDAKGKKAKFIDLYFRVSKEQSAQKEWKEFLKTNYKSKFEEVK
ncbi:MAG TPA: hypothetical protein PK514_14240 [Spirochaetota bacterium]|nr:hypothetical protein [Spirochaetota bacterium]